MTTKTITLPDALAAFVEDQVALGRYETESDVIGEALTRLAGGAGPEAGTDAALRAAVEAGVADWKAGRLDDRPVSVILDAIVRDLS